MKLHSSLPHLATQIGGGGNFKSFLPLHVWALLKAKGQPWEPQEQWIYHGMLSGLRPFQEYLPKRKPEANSNSISHLNFSVLPQVCFLITHSPPYAFILISLGPSQKHTAINTLQSKGTKNPVKNPYGKLLCFKHQLINSQKHPKCFKSSIAFTSHKWESWILELNLPVATKANLCQSKKPAKLLPHSAHTAVGSQGWEQDFAASEGFQQSPSRCSDTTLPADTT